MLSQKSAYYFNHFRHIAPKPVHGSMPGFEILLPILCYLLVACSPIFTNFHGCSEQISIFSPEHEKSTATIEDYGTSKPFGIFNSINIFRTFQPSLLPRWKQQHTLIQHLSPLLLPSCFLFSKFSHLRVLLTANLRKVYSATPSYTYPVSSQNFIGDM